MSRMLPRENELLDSGWKEETVDGLEEPLMTDFGKDFSLSALTSASGDWANTSSCSRERLIDESRNVAPSDYRVRNVQENLKLDLKSSFDNSSPSNRKERSPKREKKSPRASKRSSSKGSVSPKRESYKNKNYSENKAEFESPSSPLSMDFPSVTDSLLPKQGLTYHQDKPTWTEEPKTRVITQQPTSWNENPMFIGNALTNGIKAEVSKPAESAAEQAPEIDIDQFTFDTSPSKDKPLKFTDFMGDETEEKPAAGGFSGAEGDGAAYNFLLDW
ncbi:uncharacterized protein LOC117101298 [Anneissia japonica]|uniref:uncharacterized protein LOC117101298 n=1 Tax=Anneissia japonica TaxID=1529436 RepID=UPI001425AF49|nr:uncharacterized protein LOC117101298 [Anneissia japonica]